MYVCKPSTISCARGCLENRITPLLGTWRADTLTRADKCRVINVEGHLVPLELPGEYCSRPGVMLGYWNQPEATAAAIKDGWMHSGDLATMNDQGWIRIVGRIKDMIIRGGKNIYLAEMEGFLVTRPAVADATVFGLSDERWGEQVCEWVRGKQDLLGNELLAWCKGKISHHKVPAHVRVVDAFPLTVTGKIQSSRCAMPRRRSKAGPDTLKDTGRSSCFLCSVCVEPGFSRQLRTP